MSTDMVGGLCVRGRSVFELVSDTNQVSRYEAEHQAK